MPFTQQTHLSITVHKKTIPVFFITHATVLHYTADILNTVSSYNVTIIVFMELCHTLFRYNINAQTH